MTQAKALLTWLSNDEEPPSKRIKIANNAFKSTELSIQRKEALLLKWLVNNVQNLSHEIVWPLTNNWLSSEQFKNLTQNEITNDDMSVIVELYLQQLDDIKDEDIIQKKHILDDVLLLCDHKVFQQYFKYNLKLYCRFLSAALGKIELPVYFIEFLKHPSVFSKNVLLEETFYKQFLVELLPVLVKKSLEFKDNQNVFVEISRIVQKCIFTGNSKKFECFFALYLEGQETEKENIVIPKAVFKHLALTFNESTVITAMNFKIIFHGYSNSFTDSIMIYKFFILLVQMLHIEISKDFNLGLPSKVKNTLSLTKAVEVIFTLLDVLSTRNFSESEVSKISFTEFLRKILKSLLFLQVRSSILYKIILTSIAINPLIIEPIAPVILVYVMNTNNKNLEKDYESVVIAVFNVFAKLHRIENFVSKLLPALKSSLNGETIEKSLTNVYNFIGLNDVQSITESTVAVSDMLTENVLQCFTNSINGLASWQVINVLKTLLFHLKVTVNEYVTMSKPDHNVRFLELLGTLISRLLQSVKIADHTMPQNVIAKLVKGLEDLKVILKDLGSAILNREHNHITMRTFLNISYVWVETYMTLSHYNSENSEVVMDRVIDNTYTACNLRYVHSYLDVKQWQLISQRITNFGEHPCKKLLQKLYIQKLVAMLLFEEQFSTDIVTNIVKMLQTQSEDTWKDLLLDKFAVNFILPKMDKSSLIFLSEKLISDKQLQEVHHVRDSITLTNALTYVVMSKINKLFKHKRKHDDEFKKNLSSKMFSAISADIFFTNEGYDDGCEANMKLLFESQEEETQSDIGSKEDKLLNFLKVFKKFPIIYSSVYIQKIVLLYLFALYKDISNCSGHVNKELEDLIIGILQTCKYQLTDIFNIELLGTQILENFEKYDVIFLLMVDNVFKNEDCIEKVEPLVNCLIRNLDNPKYLSCSILVLQTINKIKKSKMDSSAKEVAHQYKEKILNKLSKLVCKSEYLIEAYATCLKHYLSLEKESETLKKLLDKLASYIQYSLETINNENKKGCAILFTAVLHNKQKIKDIEENIVLKIWNACKKVDVGEEYSHLVKLIVTLIPNDEFHLLVKDLLLFTENSINDKNYTLLARQLKTWESILTCDVNPIKMKVWQEVLEQLVVKLLDILKNCEYDEGLFKNIVHLEESIIQTQRFILSPPLIDMFIITTSILMLRKNETFNSIFNNSITILEKLLKHRNAMIMDRLPAFLQQYRIVLNNICARSNSDHNENCLSVNKASDCAHKLEKLTKNLAYCKKDMGRIAVFLIADILERYEQINLYPNVKLHLNNCIYSLIALCDHHAVSYLMRVLSSASTEMFKILYEHYKKYYMFTGRV